MRYLFLPVLLALSACSARQDESPEIETTATEHLAEDELGELIANTPDVVCERDAHGLPLMAQVIRPGVISGGVELPVFAPFYYVRSRQDGVCTLAANKHDSSIVHVDVPEDALTYWSSLVGAYPLGRVNVYETFEQVEQLIRTGKTAAPIAVRASSSERRPFLWPIVEQRSVRVGDQQRAAWRINFLGMLDGNAQPRPKPKKYSPAQIQRFHRQLRELDVAWVVDASGSMDRFWTEARKVVDGITSRLARGHADRQPDVRFGLVAFRDHGQRNGYVTRTSDFGNEEAFSAALGTITVGRGGDVPEAGLEAMQAALDLSWRPSQLTTRVMVMVSDASYHDNTDASGKPTQSAIIERAQQAGIHVICLAVGRQQTTSRDRRHQAKQYETISAATDGATFSIERADAAASMMEQMLSNASDDIANRERVLDVVEAGYTSTDEIAARATLSPDTVTECLQFLRGAIDLDRLSPGEPTFATGWVVPEFKGRRLLDMRVLLSRSDCELLRDTYRNVISKLADTKVTKKIVDIALGGRSGLGLDADLANYLGARRGLRFGKDSVLHLTLAQIAHMSQTDRRDRLDEIALALTRLLEFSRDDANFFVVNSVSYAFLPEAVLP